MFLGFPNITTGDAMSRKKAAIRIFKGEREVQFGSEIFRLNHDASISVTTHRVVSRKRLIDLTSEDYSKLITPIPHDVGIKVTGYSVEKIMNNGRMEYLIHHG